MELTPETPIADLVRQVPAAIAVLQRYGVAFCCTGSTPLSEACAHHGIAQERLLADIENARAPRVNDLAPDAPLGGVIAYIQERYHQPLREELPRIAAMLEKLVRRHGDRLPDVLPPLQATFERFRAGMIEHMAREGRGFDLLESEHRDAQAALVRMRDLTNSYTPPDDACPTFRGVYYALSELEQDTECHIRFEHDRRSPS